jgi:hypothetical protein
MLLDDGTPFLVTRRIGKGSVAWLASGLTGLWNTLAKTNAMLLCDRLLRGMLADTLPEHTVPSADRFTLPVACCSRPEAENKKRRGRPTPLRADLLGGGCHRCTVNQDATTLAHAHGLLHSTVQNLYKAQPT